MDVFLTYLWKVILGICLLNGCFTFIIGDRNLGTIGFSSNMFLMGLLPYMLFLHFVKNGIFNVFVSSIISFLFLCVICYVGIVLLVKFLRWQEEMYD